MPDNTLAAIRLAIAEGRMADAESQANEYLSKNSDSPEVVLLLAIVAIKRDRGSVADGLLRRLLAEDPDFVEAQVWRSRLMRRAVPSAIRAEALRLTLASNPDSIPLLTELASCYIQDWRSEKALPLLDRALSLDPNYMPALDALGLALYHDGKNAAAEAALQKAIELEPNEPAPYANLGRLLSVRGANDEAETLHGRAMARFRDLPTKLLEFAEASIDRGDFKHAQAALERVIELDSSNSGHHIALARVSIGRGDFERAFLEYRTGLDLGPPMPAIYQEFVNCRKFTAEDQPLIDQMRRLLGLPQCPPQDRKLLQYAVGKAYDDLGEYGKAMVHFDEANGIGRFQFAKNPFDRTAHSRFVDAAIRTFTKPFFAANRALGDPSDMPIFIIGMQRSGTTLVEQIVSNHPDVGAGGEVAYLLDRHAEAYQPDEGLNPAKLSAWVCGYLNKLRVTAPNEPRVTDKLPNNFLIAGLIHVAMPNAKFIHCRRNPLDTCLSIYTTGSIADNAKSFADIAFCYREYERLMAHWRAVLPADRFFELDYEEVVEHREASVRKLIEFLALPWDAAVLKHESNDRTVATPSLWQARQPIYRTSVERWRNYEPWIGELLKEFA